MIEYRTMERKGWGEVEGLAYESPTRRTGRSVIRRKLRVRFRSDYRLFRLEVARAIGRYTVYRSDKGKRARAHVGRHEDWYRSKHMELQLLGARDGELVILCLKFVYRGRPSHRRVVDVIPC